MIRVNVITTDNGEISQSFEGMESAHEYACIMREVYGELNVKLLGNGK